MKFTGEQILEAASWGARAVPAQLEEDAVGAACLALLKMDPAKIPEGLCLRAALKRKARWAAIDFVRRYTHSVRTAGRSYVLAPEQRPGEDFEFDVAEHYAVDDGEAAIRDADDRMDLLFGLRGLLPRERRAALLYLCSGHTLAEVGAAMGYGESRASQVVKGALQHVASRLGGTVARVYKMKVGSADAPGC